MYSQNNEEDIVKRFFGNYKGAFLDLGANDGITLSNTFALANSGWVGTLVEASPAAYERLKICYENMTGFDLINTAIGAHNGKIILHESGQHLGTGDVSLVSTTKEAEKDRWLDHVFNDVTVPCCNFSVLMGLSTHKKFNFISIDIEGMELEVLPQIDLHAVGCQLLCVEFNGKEQERYDSIVLPQGYKLIHKNAENLIYAKNRNV